MTVTLELSAELQERLAVRAAAQGLDVATWAQGLLESVAMLEWPTPEERLAYGTARMREVAAERGYDWDTLSEAGQTDLINTILHE